jgi:hypothetical protein
MKKLIIILSAVVLMAQTTLSFAQGPASSGVLFLLIAPGARPGGMGESFVSIADDATATYWNPAGMAFQNRRQISLMHSNWLPQLSSDFYYDYATMVQPMGAIGALGMSLTYLNLGEQVITGEGSSQPLGTFSSYDLAVAASYANKLSENSALGVTLKFIHSNLAPLGAGAEKGDGRATAFAADLGFLKKNLLIDRLNFGVNLTNLGPAITYVDAAQADPLPTALRLGFSYQLMQQEHNRLTLATEVDRLLVARNREGKAEPVFKAMLTSWADEPLKDELRQNFYNLGAEYVYNNFIALRTGYHYDQAGKVKYLTFGGGLKYAALGLDFGYISAGEGHPLSDTMRFSLSLGL